jgi:tRNA (guanine-N7-)-methyltransferase
VRKPRRLSPEELAPYLWTPTDPPQPIDWPALFGNPNPVEIEVGSGKGLFLLTAATSCPVVNFFGIELAKKYALYAAGRLAVRKLVNAKMAPTDAGRVLRDSVPDASVQGVHVYFPDPWWKARHKKRRVFTPAFALSCRRILLPGGKLHVATDVEEYFGVMTGIVADLPEFRPLSPPAPAGGDYLTNFERKARQKGQPVYRALYEKA